MHYPMYVVKVCKSLSHERYTTVNAQLYNMLPIKYFILSYCLLKVKYYIFISLCKKGETHGGMPIRFNNVFYHMKSLLFSG